MKPRIIFKILLIISLILLAVPLLGALAIIASGDGFAAPQIPVIANSQMMGLAIIWKALILVLIVTAIASIGSSVRPKNRNERETAA